MFWSWSISLSFNCSKILSFSIYGFLLSAYRLSSGITNVEALKYIFSGTVEDISELEKQAAPVFCRVDFIDAHLGAEIVNIIKEWVDSCKIPSTQKSYINRFQKRKNIIAKGIDFSLPVLTIGLNIGVFEKLLQILDTTIVHTQLRLLAYWIIGSFSAVFVSKQISLFLAKRVFKILDNYGEYSVFELTSGDKKRKSIIESENKVALRNFWLNLFVAFVLNILAGLITAYLIK